jgi:hypothetical protein
MIRCYQIQTSQSDMMAVPGQGEITESCSVPISSSLWDERCELHYRERRTKSNHEDSDEFHLMFVTALGCS